MLEEEALTGIVYSHLPSARRQRLTVKSSILIVADVPSRWREPAP